MLVLAETKASAHNSQKTPIATNLIQPVGKHQKKMKLKFYLIIFFIIGFFFIKIIFPILSNELKISLEKRNPELVKNVNWFFSFHKFLIPILGIMTLIIIILIWTNVIVITE